MTPEKVREMLANHYADVAPRRSGLTALDVANEVMDRMGGHVPMSGGAVNGYQIVKVVLEVLQDHGVLELEAT